MKPKIVSAPDFQTVYAQLTRLLTDQGVWVEISYSDGSRRWMVEYPGPVTWVVEHPHRGCWSFIPGRRLNPFFAAAEVFWILGGRADASWIAQFNRGMLNFLDPGEDIYNAPYGQRIFRWGIEGINQIDAAVNRLLEDPSSRRAVVCLWDPRRDHSVSRDIACNVAVQFLVRGGKLHTYIYQRSNDLIWGTPHNILQFQHLAADVMGRLEAGGLRVDRGCHAVTVGSMHYYVDLYPDKLATVRDWAPRAGYFEHPEVFPPSPGRLQTLLRMVLGEFFIGGRPTLIEEGNALDYWDSLAALTLIYRAGSTKAARREALRRYRLSDPFPALVEDFWS